MEQHPIRGRGLPKHSGIYPNDCRLATNSPPRMIRWVYAELTFRTEANLDGEDICVILVPISQPRPLSILEFRLVG